MTRCGGGSVEAMEACGVQVAKWDIEETKKGGPFKVHIALYSYYGTVRYKRLMAWC
jgi:hypothetical protein